MWGDAGPRTDNPCTRREGLAVPEARCGQCARLGALWIEQPGGKKQTIYFCTLSGEAKRVTRPACALFRTADAPDEEGSPCAEATP